MPLLMYVPRILIVLGVFFAVVQTGCTTKITDSVIVPVNVIEAQELVHGKKKLMGLGGTQAGTWVDCRPETEFRAGHIPGAIHLPYERVSLDHKRLKNFDVIVVYGGDYNDTRAHGMSKRLVELGYDDVRTLTGGLRAWKTDGNPVEVSQ